jgi:hypothetical protein
VTDTNKLDALIARWDSNNGKPYKGRLIDWHAYEADSQNIGCMCAQGQVLHLVGGWTPQRLRVAQQSDADKATAKLLNISTAHAVLLRSVNDKIDGAPSIVLTHPEKVLGDQAHIVLAFWRHLDDMTGEQWIAAGNAAWDARNAAGDAAWDAAGNEVGNAARTVARTVVQDAAWDAAGDAAGNASWNAAGACSEIQGARIMREKGQAFTFLPVFGFADPEAVLVADQEKNDGSRRYFKA